MCFAQIGFIVIDTRIPNRIPSNQTTVGRLIQLRPVFQDSDRLTWTICHRRDAMHLAQAMVDVYRAISHVQIWIPLGLRKDERDITVLTWYHVTNMETKKNVFPPQIEQTQLPSAPKGDWTWRRIGDLNRVTFWYSNQPWTKESEIMHEMLVLEEDVEEAIEAYKETSGHCRIEVKKCTGFRDRLDMVPHRPSGYIPSKERSDRCVKVLAFETFGNRGYRSPMTVREDGWNQLMVALGENYESYEGLKCTDCCGVPYTWELEREPSSAWPDWVSTYASDDAYCVCKDGHSSQRERRRYKDWPCLPL